MYEFIEHCKGNCTRTRVVDRSEARDLLRNHTRDISHALMRLENNPWGQIKCEGGMLRWNPGEKK